MKNFSLSKAVLKSNLQRLLKCTDKLKLYDESLKSHLNDKIIEKIDDLPKYLNEHPNVSFIPHMGVFRMNHENTQCRVVLLSNLVEKSAECVSHNQAMLPGVNLNQKISTALTKLRFDKFLLSFDVVKAFLNIGIREVDQDKLMIL